VSESGLIVAAVAGIFLLLFLVMLVKLHAVVALLIATLLAFTLPGTRRGFTRDEVQNIAT